jgi:hypothetical protein
MRTKNKAGGNKYNGIRRLIGVKEETLEKMVKIVGREEKKRRKRGGQKRGISVRGMVKMMLEYYRQYRTYYQIGESYKMSESNAYRTIKYVEEILIKSGEYRLDGKKSLTMNGKGVEIVITDATEMAIERPKKNKRNTTAGRRKNIR